MPDERSELDTKIIEGLSALKAVTAKPVVVRSFAWATIFAGIGLLLHPTIVHYRNNYLGVFVVIALFGLSMAKLTEHIYVRTQKASTIEGTEFVLRHAGEVVGRFGHDDGLASLTLSDKDGVGRVFLSTAGLALLGLRPHGKIL